MAGILGYLIQSSRERAEKEKQAEKVANASYDLLTPEDDPESGAATPHPYGMTKDQWTGLSRADRIARHAAYQEKLGEQSVLAKIKSYGALEDERRAAVEDERVTGQFLRNYLTAPEPGSGDYGGEAPDATPYAGMEGRFRWAAEQTPNLAGRHLPRIIEALSRYQTVAGKEAGGTAPQVDILDLPFGNKGAVLRGSKDLKTFSNPDAINAGAIPQEDENGNLIGHSIPTGRGGYRFVPKVSEASEAPIISPDGKFYRRGKDWVPLKEDPNAVLADALRDRIAGRTNAPASGGRSAATPKAMGGYKIGTIYSGLRYLGGDPNLESSWQPTK